MTHPLTDEMILELVKHISETTDWNNCDEYPSTLYARAAADWQLDRCTEELNGILYMFQLAGKTSEAERMALLKVFKNAMRPQQQEDTND